MAVQGQMIDADGCNQSSMASAEIRTIKVNVAMRAVGIGSILELTQEELRQVACLQFASIALA